MNILKSNTLLDLEVSTSNSNTSFLLIPKFNNIYDKISTLNLDSHGHVNFELSSKAYMKTEQKSLILKSPIASADIMFQDLNLLYEDLTFQKIANICDFDSSNDGHFKEWEFHDCLFHLSSRARTATNKMGLVKPHFQYKGKSDFAKNAYYEAPKSELDKIFANRKSGYIKEVDLTKNLIHKLLSTCLQSKTKERFPYPSAGGFYENNFYLLINEVKELDHGLYFYNKQSYSLEKLEYSKLELQKLQASINITPNDKNEIKQPQAALFITTDYEKLSQKYHEISYRLTLLNAGVIAQTFSLACAELGIAGYISSIKDYSNIKNVLQAKNEPILEFILP